MVPSACQSIISCIMRAHAGVVDFDVAVVVEVLRALADGGAGETVAGAVHRPSRSGVPVASATWRVTAAHSSQVPLSGTSTPACSKSVSLTYGPVTVSWVMKPGIASEPAGRIQSRKGPKLVSQ